MPRPQFTLRALLVLMLVVGCFFGGIRFERERRRRADEAAESAAEGQRSKAIHLPLSGPEVTRWVMENAPPGSMGEDTLWSPDTEALPAATATQE